MRARVYEFRVNDLRCAVVSDGAAAAPLSIFFNPETGVSEAALRQGLADDGSGRTIIDVNYNCLLVRGDSGTVLIDTGLGERFLGYGEEIFFAAVPLVPTCPLPTEFVQKRIAA